MKADGVAKLYDKLSVDERFRLRLHALARRDLADCERLDRACPSSEYRAYFARLDASDTLTLCMLTELLPRLAKLQMAAAVRPLVEHLAGAVVDAACQSYVYGHAAGWRAACGSTDPPEVPDADLEALDKDAEHVGAMFTEILDRLTASLAASARTSRDGIGQFADERLGVPPEVLLGAWGRQTLAVLADHAAALDAATPDADDLALSARVLDLAWRRQGLNDPTVEMDDDLRDAVAAIGWPAR
jgi:hypothetical protein